MASQETSLRSRYLKSFILYHVPDNTVDSVEAPKREEIFISLPFLGPISIIVKMKLLRLIHNFYPGIRNAG